MRWTWLLGLVTLWACTDGAGTLPTGDPNDRDGDGFSPPADCNDADPTINPDAEDEVGDDIDQNCDGIDGVDADQDGYASEASGGDDCDDDDPDRNPGADEIPWNGVDEDCNGVDLKNWTLVGLGDYVTCGVKSTGEFLCWGEDEVGQVSDAPSGGVITSVDGSGEHLCAVQDGQVVCWGDDTYGIVSGSPAGDTFTRVDVGPTVACALTDLGETFCWGDNTHEQLEGIPAQQVDSVAVGSRHVCAVYSINADFNGICWGDQSYNPQEDGNLPRGPYRTFVSGDEHMCGVLTNGTLKCWGSSNFGQSTPINATGPYTDISAAGSHTCGILSGSQVVCWGRNNFGQLDHPGFTAIRIRTARDHTCSINGVGLMRCWGNNNRGQSDVP